MASTYLKIVPSSTGNRKTFSISTWVKRGNLSAFQGIIGARYFDGDTNGSYRNMWLRFTSSDTFMVYDAPDQGANINLQTNAVFRDVSAWYHIVVAVDTTQATASNRVKIYINGIQETSFSTSTYPSLNQDTEFNLAGNEIYIGTLPAFTGGPDSNRNFDGEMTHFHLTDGTAYDASAFGETDATTGEWKIKTSPSVTYGTNGFFILKDGNSVTDQSGNSNNFTVAGGTLTNTEDSPSNVFATLNPLLDVNNSPTFSNGNTTATGSSTGTARFTGSNLCVSSGKWYYEVKVTVSSSSPYVGVIDAQSNLRRNSLYFVDAASGDNDSGYAVNMSGDIYHNNSNSYATNIGSISTGDILGFAIDLDSAQRTCEIYKNGVSQRSFNLAEPSSGAYMLACSSTYNEASAKAEVNFGNGYFGTTAVSTPGTNASGNGIFEYDVPTGYTALSTKGLNL
jgi:hypothetical protein